MNWASTFWPAKSSSFPGSSGKLNLLTGILIASETVGVRGNVNYKCFGRRSVWNPCCARACSACTALCQRLSNVEGKDCIWEMNNSKHPSEWENSPNNGQWHKLNVHLVLLKSNRGCQVSVQHQTCKSSMAMRKVERARTNFLGRLSPLILWVNN